MLTAIAFGPVASIDVDIAAPRERHDEPARSLGILGKREGRVQREHERLIQNIGAFHAR